MVLMRRGRTEQCEDSVAGILHAAIVTACRIDHYFQRRVDDRARLLGIEVLLELGRALDVGEQRGDRLALAFWSVGYWSLRGVFDLGGFRTSGFMHRGSFIRSKRCSALSTKIGIVR